MPPEAEEVQVTDSEPTAEPTSVTEQAPDTKAESDDSEFAKFEAIERVDDDKDEAGEPAAESEGETDKDEAVESARSVLRRWNTPDEVINSLDREKVIAWADKAKHTQSEGDRIASELDRIKNRPSDDDAVVEPEEDEAPTKPDSLLAGLRAEYGDELADPIEAAIRGIEEKFESRINALTARETNRQLDAARSNLLSDVPQIKDKDSYDQVLSRMYSLAGSPDADERYGGDVEAVMREAALLEFGAEAFSAVKQRVASEHKNRTASQSDAPSNNKKPIAGMSREELEYMAMSALEDGNIEEQQRLTRQIRQRTE